MDGSSQGRGISALEAISDHEFLVLERNNRGLGVDANLASPNKKVFRIDLTGATDVTGVNLVTAPAGSWTPVTKVTTPWLDLAAPATLPGPSLAALGSVSPEKWEGLTVGPRLNDGSAGSPVPAGFNFTGYALIPGVLHAYKASADDLAGLVRPGSTN